MGFNPLDGLRALLDAATSHVPFGVGAQYSQDKQAIANGPVPSHIQPQVPHAPVVNPQNLQQLSMDPHQNFMNRQPLPQQSAQPLGLQVLLNRGQQPFGRGQEDDYTPQQAIQNPGFTNQTPLNGQFVQGPGATQLRQLLRY